MDPEEDDPWKKIRSVDDLVLPEVREVIDWAEQQSTIRCPHLKREGRWFYYCSGAIPDGMKLELDPSNPIIVAGQESAQLQLHCMDRFEACCHYKGTLPFPGAFLVKPSSE